MSGYRRPIVWEYAKPWRKPRLPGLSIYLGGTVKATTSGTLGEVLDGHRIQWGAERETGLICFRLHPRDTQGEGVKVNGNQVQATAVLRLGVPRYTRLIFEYDQDEDVFREIERILPDRSHIRITADMVKSSPLRDVHDVDDAV